MDATVVTFGESVALHIAGVWLFVSCAFWMINSVELSGILGVLAGFLVGDWITGLSAQQLEVFAAWLSHYGIIVVVAIAGLIVGTEIVRVKIHDG